MRAKNDRLRRVGWAVAGCLAVVIGIALFAWPRGTHVQMGGLPRYYRQLDVLVNELGYIWPWEQRTPAEQYSSLTWAGQIYRARGGGIDPALLDGPLGSVTATGSDDITGTQHTKELQAYRIAGIDPSLLLAAQPGSDYIVYAPEAYAPPATLGQLLESYRLPEVLPLQGFAVSRGAKEEGYYTLAEDAVVWDILASCGTAAFAERDGFDYMARRYVAFTATSPQLGIHNRAFIVTQDGWLWTNIFDFLYLYEIGEQAAEAIFAAVEAGSTPAERPAPPVSLIGTVTEVTGEYIAVDDTLRCVRPREGMQFRVPLADIRIRRYVDAQVQLGDIVIVQFTGDIDTLHRNTVAGAYAIEEGYIQSPE